MTASPLVCDTLSNCCIISEAARGGERLEHHPAVIYILTESEEHTPAET